jgi:hypothetical protein
MHKSILMYQLPAGTGEAFKTKPVTSIMLNPTHKCSERSNATRSLGPDAVFYTGK